MERLKHHAHRALRHSEKYFKTDMVYLAKGSFWLGVGQGVASLSSFILAVAFANLLPKETYGEYKYVLAIAGTLTIFTLTGMGTALTQSVAKGNVQGFRAALKAKLTWGALGSLITLLIAFYYFINENTVLALAFCCVSVLMPLMEAFSLYASVLEGKKDFRTSTKYFMYGQIGSGSLSILILLFTKNVVALVVGYFVSWVLFRYFFLRRTLSQNPDNKTEDVSVVTYGKHLSWMNILNVVSTYADRILLFHYVGAAEAAIYAIAMAVPEQAKGVFKNISVLAFPKFSEKNLSEIKKTIYPKLLQMGIMIVFATLAYIVVAPYLFKIIFPQYIESIFYSQIFSLSLISILSAIPIAVLQSQQKTRELYIHSISTPILQLILLGILIPLYGIMGAIIARIIARFFVLILSLVLLSKAAHTETN